MLFSKGTFTPIMSLNQSNNRNFFLFANWFGFTLHIEPKKCFYAFLFFFSSLVQIFTIHDIIAALSCESVCTSWLSNSAFSLQSNHTRVQ